ncbi:MAG: RNA methyltransferase [Halorhodospira halophila]|uniref:RNA methyltransferase n=1 Tax=Halorhodospira TaxID=85108 RepID=UPI001912E07D|nr:MULTISPECIES: RNA methyltransferase [Halorhodospira]MBK5936254.1 hypothetical protein [Halorhodospira halophila]MCC3749853.1 RNA methyltransferase [Halorhodospira halophila]MCG5527773.1 RNA methyltransferase [Halorhodospira halophila]MCG5532765.1 RNA methyltransferase [Halorhodospira sp. 9621]MCG5537056.1 RNA methyltransferase [Halorhodospira sp. 9622]
MSLERTRIVLVGTTHPGNIGAAARAMRTMGLRDLCLVDPQCDPDDPEAVARAAGAGEVLEQAQRYPDLASALAGCRLAFGLSARIRAERQPRLALRPAAESAAAEGGEGGLAWVFGRERTGLTNAELDHCHYLVQIPTDADYSSLNVAQSVQLVAWELRMAAEVGGALPQPETEEPPAAVDTLERFFVHLEEMAGRVGYLDRHNPALTMRRLRNIFRRARLTEDEVRMLRGLLSHVLNPRRWRK